MGNMIFNQRLMDGDDKKYNYDNYKDNNSSGEEAVHMERRIFPQHRYGGPKGLGDPHFRGLSKMEEDPLIPQRSRDITRTQICTREHEEFCKCSKENGFSMVYYCREAKDKMVDCQKTWFDKPQFQEAVKEEYLNERSHYRESGIKTQRYKRGAFVMRNIEADPPLDKDGNYRPQKPTGWDESYPDGPPKWANFMYN